MVKGVAYDTPVPGYRASTVNLLRLWKAEATESFDFDAFNVGDYYGAVDEKVLSETISKVLYPNDEPESRQAAAADAAVLLRVVLAAGHDPPPSDARQATSTTFHQYWAAQLNDTHPSIAIAELMRLLVDEHRMDWDRAWTITQQTCGYTNHTLLAEALEKMAARPVRQRCCRATWRSSTRSTTASSTTCGGSIRATISSLRRLSLIDEAGERYVRMAHLASVGSHAINGVAALHTRAPEADRAPRLPPITPEKFLNVTNGVTPRRWIALSNPKLTALITRHIGDRWISDLEDELPRIEPLADDTGFQTEWRAVKAENKKALADVIRERTGVTVDPHSLFDIQVKRLHEYKRQHLNVLHLVTLYNRLRRPRRRASRRAR